MTAAARLLTLVCPALLLAACATTRSSVLAVKRIDRNQFEVTSHVIGGLGGADEVKAKNEQIAAGFCADKGQQFTVVNRHSYGGVASQDILTFRCADTTTAIASMPKPRRSPANVDPALSSQ